MAIEKNNLNLVRIFLKNGADPSTDSEDGITAVLVAAFFGATEIFFELLATEKKFYQRTGLEEISPFLIACGMYRNDLIKALVEHGVCLNDVEECNNNCLHILSKKKKGRKAFLYLADNLGDRFESMLKAQNEDGKSSLDFIFKRKDEIMIRRIVAVDPELTNYSCCPTRIKFKSEDHEICLICHEEFDVEDLATKLSCRHLYHKAMGQSGKIMSVLQSKGFFQILKKVNLDCFIT